MGRCEDDKPVYPQSREYNRRKDAFVGALQIIQMTNEPKYPPGVFLDRVLVLAEEILAFYEGTGDGATD